MKLEIYMSDGTPVEIIETEWQSRSDTLLIYIEPVGD